MCDMKGQGLANHNYNNNNVHGGADKRMPDSLHPMIRVESVDENENVRVLINGGDAQQASQYDNSISANENESNLQARRALKRPTLPFSVEKMLDCTASAPASPSLLRHRTRTFSDRQSCGSPVGRAPPPSFPAPPPSPTPQRIGVTTADRRRSWRNQRGISWDPERISGLPSDNNNRNVFNSPLPAATTDGDDVFITNTQATRKDNKFIPSSNAGGNAFDPLRPLSPLPPDLAAQKRAMNARRRPHSLHVDTACRLPSRTDEYPASPRTPRRTAIPSRPKPNIEPPPSPSPSIKLRERVRSSRSRAASTRNLARSRSVDNALLNRQNRVIATTAKNEDEVLGKANKMQLDLILSKKVMEKQMSAKLEESMEKKDNLVGALRRSMNEPRCKDKVKTANKEIKRVINSQVKLDPESKRKYYQVTVQLGNYTADVHTTVSDYHVFLSGSTRDGPKFTKEINIEFPNTVRMEEIDVIQVQDQMILVVPFKHTAPPATQTDLASEQGDPNNPANRLGFLEELFHSMNLPWPPEGATAHYEYLTGRYMGDQKENTADLKCDYLFSKNSENATQNNTETSTGDVPAEKTVKSEHKISAKDKDRGDLM